MLTPKIKHVHCTFTGSRLRVVKDADNYDGNAGHIADNNNNV